MRPVIYIPSEEIPASIIERINQEFPNAVIYFTEPKDDGIQKIVIRKDSMITDLGILTNLAGNLDKLQTSFFKKETAWERANANAPFYAKRNGKKRW